MSESDEVSVSTELEIIGDMWQSDVFVVYRQEWDEWIIRNHTDEGLTSAEVLKTARGDTLEEAIEKIKQGDYETR